LRNQRDFWPSFRTPAKEFRPFPRSKLLAEPSKQKEKNRPKKKTERTKIRENKNTRNERKDKAVTGLAQIDKALLA